MESEGWKDGDGCELLVLDIHDMKLMRDRFILEGLLTVVCAVLAFFVIWDEPSTATFLSGREKAIIIDLLADSRASSTEGQLEEKSAFDWKQFLAAVLDWQVSYQPFNTTAALTISLDMDARHQLLGSGKTSAQTT
jgi:hypothetical protein